MHRRRRRYLSTMYWRDKEIPPSKGAIGISLVKKAQKVTTFMMLAKRTERWNDSGSNSSLASFYVRFDARFFFFSFHLLYFFKK